MAKWNLAGLQSVNPHLPDYAQQNANAANPYAGWQIEASRAALEEVLADDIPEIPYRAELLSAATSATMGERQADYGDPVEMMDKVVSIFNAISGRDLTKTEGAEFLMALKLARMQVTPTHRDSHVDLMAYAGIRAECAEAESK